MRAALLREFGGHSALDVEDVDDPVPASDEVVIAVEAVSLNRTLDLAVMSGRWPVPVLLPHVPGIDPAGRILVVGAAVRDWRVGDRVAIAPKRCGACESCRWGESETCLAVRMPGVGGWGGAATRYAAHASTLRRIPDGVTAIDASYAVRHGSLALGMIRRKLKLRSGQSILVTGAAGALGTAAVQIAHASGIEVIAAAGSEERAHPLLGLGASRAISYDQVHTLTGQVNGVIETSGDAATWEAALSALKRNGSLVSSASSQGALATVDLARLYIGRLTISGASLGSVTDEDDALALAGLGQLRAPVAARFRLADIADAYAMAAGRVAGKIYLEPEISA